jgi:hypothetical protein
VSRKEKIHPSLKHGIYSTLTLLPGENPDDFEKLYKKVKADLSPSGPLEEDIVAQISRLLWRKQNLAIFSIADRARNRYSIIRGEQTEDGRIIKRFTLNIFDSDNRLVKQVDNSDRPEAAAEREAREAIEAKARRTLGETYELVKIGKTATVGQLLSDLAVEERLDAMIERCMKRLLFLRGLKSISAMPSSAPTRDVGASSKAARRANGLMVPATRPR